MWQTWVSIPRRDLRYAGPTKHRIVEQAPQRIFSFDPEERPFITKRVLQEITEETIGRVRSGMRSNLSSNSLISLFAKLCLA